MATDKVALTCIIRCHRHLPQALSSVLNAERNLLYVNILDSRAHRGDELITSEGQRNSVSGYPRRHGKNRGYLSGTPASY